MIGRYYVWNPLRGQPTRPHDSYQSAEEEARRLARLNPGSKFLVLRVLADVEMPDPVVVQRIDDDIPF